MTPKVELKRMLEPLRKAYEEDEFIGRFTYLERLESEVKKLLEDSEVL